MESRAPDPQCVYPYLCQCISTTHLGWGATAEQFSIFTQKQRIENKTKKTQKSCSANCSKHSKTTLMVLVLTDEYWSQMLLISNSGQGLNQHGWHRLVQCMKQSPTFNHKPGPSLLPAWESLQSEHPRRALPNALQPHQWPKSNKYQEEK